MSESARALVDVHAHFLTDHYVAEARRFGYTMPDGMLGWPQWDAGTHLTLMDRHHIERSLLSISSPGVHFGDDSAGRAMARHVNDAASATAAKHPGRFGFLGALPLPDVDGSVREVGRVFDDLGADGVIMLTNSRGIYLADPVLDPVLAALDQRHAVILVHPTSPPGVSTTLRTVPSPVLEFIFETTRAVTDLVLTGTLLRYPHLRLVVPHAGAALPLIVDRVETFWSRLAPPASGASEPSFGAQTQQLWYDTAGATFPHQVAALTRAFGADRIVYGSDYCWTPPAGVEAQLRRLHTAANPRGGTDWRTLTTLNANRLFGHEEGEVRAVSEVPPVKSASRVADPNL